MMPGQEPPHTHDPAATRSRSSLAVLIAVALVGFAADQATKALAFATPADQAGPREIVPGLFTGALAVNDGVMANLGGGHPLTAPVSALQSLTLLGAAGWFAYRGCNRFRAAVAAGLLVAGMLGNAADRLALGHVRDFLVATAFPAWTFNLADVLIVLGALPFFGSWAASTLRASGREPGGMPSLRRRPQDRTLDRPGRTPKGDAAAEADAAQSARLPAGPSHPAVSSL